MIRFLDRYAGVYFAPDEPPTGGDLNDPPADPPADPADPPKTFDEEYVKKLRAEAAANRKRATEAEARLKTLDDEKLTETEKLKKAAQEATDKLTATEQRVRARVLKAEVIAAATKLNFHDPDTALALVRDQVEFDDDGEPRDVAKRLEALAKEKPFLVKGDDKTPVSGGGPANPAGSRGGPTPPGRIPSWENVFNKR